MSIINTPGYYKNLADIYYQLGALTSAGVTLSSALQHLLRNVRNRRIKVLLTNVLYSIQQGETLADAFRKTGEAIPEFDLALIEASEKSGRLESCFKLLSSHYQQRARNINQFIANIAYPAFLLHFAVFIFPFAEFFRTGNLLVYLGKTVGLLLPLYAVVFLIIFALQPHRNQIWREMLEKIVRRIPLFGSGRQSLVLSRFAFALGSLLNAGIPIISALELAASASGSVALKKTVESWRERLTNGASTPSEEISRSRHFPDVFASQYATGEISGSLDSTLERLHSYYLEEATRKLKSALQWTGNLIFILIALAIAVKIIMFYLNYYQQIGNALDNM